MLNELNNIENLEELMKSFKSHDVVCLYPRMWQDFYQYFQKQIPSQILPTPLILNGWGSSDFDKRERFEEHLTIINRHLGIKPLVRYFVDVLKEKHFHKAKNINPDELSYWELIGNDFDNAHKFYFKGSKILMKMIKLQPSLIESEELFQLIFNYQEKMGKASYQKPKVKLVYDSSELVSLIFEFYEVFEEQKNNTGGSSDLIEFCEYVTNQLLETLSWESDEKLKSCLLDNIETRDIHILHEKINIIETYSKDKSGIINLELFVILDELDTFEEIMGLPKKISLETHKFKVIWKDTHGFMYFGPSDYDIDAEIIDQDTDNFLDWDDDRISQEVFTNLFSYYLDFVGIGENLDKIYNNFKDIKIKKYPPKLQPEIKKILKKYLDYQKTTS